MSRSPRPGRGASPRPRARSERRQRRDQPCWRHRGAGSNARPAGGLVATSRSWIGVAARLSQSPLSPELSGDAIRSTRRRRVRARTRRQDICSSFLRATCARLPCIVDSSRPRRTALVRTMVADLSVMTAQPVLISEDGGTSWSSSLSEACCCRVPVNRGPWTEVHVYHRESLRDSGWLRVGSRNRAATMGVGCNRR